MKLADLRRLSIRQNVKIRFQLSNGLECVITERGVARGPPRNMPTVIDRTPLYVELAVAKSRDPGDRAGVMPPCFLC